MNMIIPWASITAETHRINWAHWANGRHLFNDTIPFVADQPDRISPLIRKTCMASDRIETMCWLSLLVEHWRQFGTVTLKASQCEFYKGCKCSDDEDEDGGTVPWSHQVFTFSSNLLHGTSSNGTSKNLRWSASLVFVISYPSEAIDYAQVHKLNDRFFHLILDDSQNHRENSTDPTYIVISKSGRHSSTAGFCVRTWIYLLVSRRRLQSSKLFFRSRTSTFPHKKSPLCLTWVSFVHLLWPSIIALVLKRSYLIQLFALAISSCFIPIGA